MDIVTENGATWLFLDSIMDTVNWLSIFNYCRIICSFWQLLPTKFLDLCFVQHLLSLFILFICYYVSCSSTHSTITIFHNANSNVLPFEF
jgi:hypothetical protein